MTTKKNVSNGSKKTTKLPKGFKPARQRLDGFFAREAGNEAQGILRGSFEVKGKFGIKRVFRIELVAGDWKGETMTADGEMASEGAIIGLDETGYTKVLSEIEPGTPVFVRYEGKEGSAKDDKHIFAVGVAE